MFILFNLINQKDTTFKRKEDGKLLLCQLVGGLWRRELPKPGSSPCSLLGFWGDDGKSCRSGSLVSSGLHVPNHLPGNLSASLRVANPLANSELGGMVSAVVPTSNCHWCSQVGSAGVLTWSSLAAAPLLSCPPSF